MADTRTPEQRRYIMQSVGTQATGPELTVRRMLTKLGYRYRLNVKKLPGKPDIVFAGRKRAIFVHGCFWHSHGCQKGRAPKSRLDYWEPKLNINRERDESRVAALRAMGWTVLTIWQCETNDPDSLRTKLIDFVDGTAMVKVQRNEIG